MKLSWNFTLAEATLSQTAKRKGIDNTPSLVQLENMKVAANGMELVRDILGKPIQVSSWFRSPKLNKVIGGSATSAHCDGFAIDFVCPQYGTPTHICTKIIASDLQFDQLIQEGGDWVHISFAPKMRNEMLTAIFKKGKATYQQGIK